MQNRFIRNKQSLYDDLQNKSKSFNRREVVKVLSSRVKKLASIEVNLNKKLHKMEAKFEEDNIDGNISKADTIKYN